MLSHFYRPQRSWGKVIFSQASVILFTGGGVVSQHALQVVSQHALQQVSGGRYPSMPCRCPGPHPGGKFRGIWPDGGVCRPTPKGEVEGDLAGGCLLPGGCLLLGGSGDPPGRLLLWAVRILLECILVASRIKKSRD